MFLCVFVDFRSRLIAGDERRRLRLDDLIVFFDRVGDTAGQNDRHDLNEGERHDGGGQVPVVGIDRVDHLIQTALRVGRLSRIVRTVAHRRGRLVDRSRHVLGTAGERNAGLPVGGPVHTATMESRLHVVYDFGQSIGRVGEVVVANDVRQVFAGRLFMYLFAKKKRQSSVNESN